jgi:hypothetical protein
MCWQHTRTQQHLQVKNSTIPHAGQGLFAWGPTRAARNNHDIVFPTNTFIAPIQGRPTSAAQLDARYGDHTAPYGASSSVARTGQPFVDGIGERYVGQYANTRLGHAMADGRRRSVQAGTNASFSSFRKDGHMWIKASKPIRSGQEILAYYGRDYLMEPNAKTKVKNQKP